jgi:hypothetical protein
VDRLVWLSPGIADLREVLTSALGEGYCVRSGSPDGPGIGVCAPHSAAGLAFLAARYPSVGWIVFDEAPRSTVWTGDVRPTGEVEAVHSLTELATVLAAGADPGPPHVRPAA